MFVDIDIWKCVQKFLTAWTWVLGGVCVFVCLFMLVVDIHVCACVYVYVIESINLNAHLSVPVTEHPCSGNK